MESAPRTGRSSPSSPSSPSRANFSSSPFAATCPVPARIPTAIGRSKALPDFAMSAGARLMVMRLGGTTKPLFWMAATTRSFPSFTAPCGRPTVEKEGRPLATSASTVTM